MVNFIPNIFAEGELVYTDGGLLAEYAWLLVVLPFIAALVITFVGKYLPMKGAEVALATIGIIFLYLVISARVTFSVSYFFLSISM